MNTTELNALVNSFAIRSFRDVADYDYIAARMAYRASLIPQFHWSGLQAIEKYLKCILLLNRIKAKNLKHDLGKALKLIENNIPFKLQLRDPSREIIQHLDTYGRFRYLETPFQIRGPALSQLDMAIWEIRRYCRVLDYEIEVRGKKLHMLDTELCDIASSVDRPPQTFRLPGGFLEQIIAKKTHPAREPLIWHNLFYGQAVRKAVRPPQYSHITNSPLSMRPEILDEVLKYVYIPSDVENAYREQLSSD